MIKKWSKVKIIKVLLFIIVVLIFCYSTIHLYPIIRNIATPEGRINFKNEITTSGINGMIMFFFLEISQIVLAIIPGEPLETLAGMCYGTIGGTIFLLISISIITAVIFCLVKKFGKKLVYEFCPKNKIDKIEKSKIFNNPKKIEKIIVILFLIPGTPKDLLIYVGGLLPIKPHRFIIISTIARFPSIISSTLAGDSIIKGNWNNTVVIYIITFIFVVLAILFINIFDKNKEAKEALNIIK